MATIRKRKGLYQVQIRRLGFPAQTKSFKSKAPAAAWARRVESSMDDGSWVDTRASCSTLIDSIIDDHIASYERFKLKIGASKLCSLNQVKDYFEGWSIHDLSVDDVMEFAAMRRKTVKANTLQKQVYYFYGAIKESDIKLTEDVVGTAIRKLSKKRIIMGSTHRDRRLEKGEYKRIKKEAGKHKWLMAAVDIALITGMRMGEIHALRFSDGRPLSPITVPIQHALIDLDKSLIALWRKDKKSANGKKFHIIPLWKDVREVLLREQDYFSKGDTLFKVQRASSIGDKFARVVEAAGIQNLTFHDLRHEALTRMFEPKELGGRGMTVEKVRLVSGHSSLDQLSRYINLRPEDLLTSEDL